ncbi:MAG: RidA family protein [Spirochaetia bacterium]|jgi:2-iminobutanoate/2-iminopropanoate deaminase|nr:RidA family protein [Spirochaetia bacterium]MCE1207994.1 RidA family protein [Spirochaetia bacterium]
MKRCIRTQAAPAAIGPYSQGMLTGNMLFVSGQLPIDPATGEMLPADTAAQTRQILKNLGAILGAAGFALSDVVKTTVFLKDLQDFTAMNEVYREFFPSDSPARSTVQVARLPKDSIVEIEAVAVKG